MSKKNSKKRIGRLKIYVIAIFAIILVLSISFLMFLNSLPDVTYLKRENPKTTSLIELRKRQAKAEGKRLKIRRGPWVNFDDIPKILKDVVRISEDAAFYHHNGIDFHELKEAIKKNLKEGKNARGASTITQQLAKNLFLTTEKSFYRKIKEYFIARRLERHLTKDRIFCIYLNVIEFGPGIFGIGAASDYFFRKKSRQLDLAEIVRLAAVIPKPLRVSPKSSSKYLKWRGNFLLKKLFKYHYISGSDYYDAKNEFR